MPRYLLERADGTTYAEYCSWDELQKHISDNPGVKQVLSAPPVLGAEFISTHRKGDKFREKLLQPKINALNPHRLSGPGL